MKKLEQAWYQGARWPLLLTPLEWLYRALAHWDRLRKQSQQRVLPVPVLVVGNISVGGTGKSPVVTMLCRELQRMGWHPGVVSRGYGGSASRSGEGPVAVDADSDPAVVGDEPVMLAAATRCPVVVDPDRYRAAHALLQPAFFRQSFPEHDFCDLIISDDGLQHLALARDIEWVVVDTRRGLGNGHCLPVGPLREPADRLQEVDLVLANGARQAYPLQAVKAQPMQLMPVQWRNLKNGICFPVNEPPFVPLKQPALAVAGIGDPERFFRSLEALGLHIERCALDDHHRYTEADLPAERLILMTAKDAVKCRHWAAENHWVLDVEASINPDIILKLHHQLLDVLKRKDYG